MRLTVLMIAALILASACLTSGCNLNNEPATPTAAETTTPEVPVTETVTDAPSLTPLPGAISTSGATRTPFGNDAPPTAQIIGTPGTFAAPTSGERASITSPANGATVSGSPLYISGIVYNLTEDKFALQVFDADGDSLTQEQTITLSNPNRVAEVPFSASVMVGSYTGVAQIRVSARTADGTTAVIGMANVTISAATQSANPAPSGGTNNGSITSPTNGSSVMGDPITVTGMARGIPDNQFTLMLLSGNGTVLNSQVITLTGAEQNSVPWSASMGTGGHKGSAEIRAVVIRDGQQVTIASTNVTLQ